MIVGYEPSAAAPGGVGHLLLGALKGEGLVYVGGVGTGFARSTGSALKRQLDNLVSQRPAVPIKQKGVVWTQPILPVEIGFPGWTDVGKLRHASYKGLREERRATFIKSSFRNPTPRPTVESAFIERVRHGQVRRHHAG